MHLHLQFRYSLEMSSVFLAYCTPFKQNKLKPEGACIKNCVRKVNEQWINLNVWK